MYYRQSQDQEAIHEIVDYNQGIVPNVSKRADKLLDLLTRPPLPGDKHSYILGRIEVERVRLRGDNEVQVRDVVEDYQFPDSVYRIPISG